MLLSANTAQSAFSRFQVSGAARQRLTAIDIASGLSLRFNKLRIHFYSSLIQFQLLWIPTSDSTLNRPNNFGKTRLGAFRVSKSASRDKITDAISISQIKVVGGGSCQR